MTVKPPKHGYDHAADGEDPGDPLAWCICSSDGLSQAVTTTTYMHLETFLTNAPDCFGYDPDLPDRIYMKQEGVYQSMLDVHVGSVDIAKQRFIYQQLSYEQVGGFGSELAPAIGTGQNASGISEVNGTPALVSKSRLTHFAHAWAITNNSGDGENGPALGPYILQGVLGHVVGNDYTVQNLNSTLCVVRLASFRNWKVSQRAN